MVFLGGHPAKYWPSTNVCAVCVCMCTALSGTCYNDPSWWQGNFVIRYYRWHHRPQHSCYATQISPSVPETVCPGVELNLYKHERTCPWVGALTNWATWADIHGFVPNGFRSSTIIPITKGYDTNLSNSTHFRGIALSSIVGKIFDNIILDRVIN